MVVAEFVVGLPAKQEVMMPHSTRGQRSGRARLNVLLLRSEHDSLPLDEPSQVSLLLIQTRLCRTVSVRGPREEDDESTDVKSSDVGGSRPRVRTKEVRQFIISLGSVTSHSLTGFSDSKDAALSRSGYLSKSSSERDGEQDGSWMSAGA